MIEMIGGPGRDRTDDLFHAMEARSQLRHRPTEKLPLVYTRESVGSTAAGLTAKFRQRIILAGDTSGGGNARWLHCGLGPRQNTQTMRWRLADTGGEKCSQLN